MLTYPIVSSAVSATLPGRLAVQYDGSNAVDGYFYSDSGLLPVAVQAEMTIAFCISSSTWDADGASQERTIYDAGAGTGSNTCHKASHYSTATGGLDMNQEYGLSSTICRSTTLPDTLDTWYGVVYSAKNFDQKLYINGSLVGSTSSNFPTFETPASAGNGMYIGRNRNNAEKHTFKIAYMWASTDWYDLSTDFGKWFTGPSNNLPKDIGADGSIGFLGQPYCYHMNGDPLVDAGTNPHPWSEVGTVARVGGPNA